MKQRNGFVSNSSSSSFIIATKADNKGRVLISLDLSELGGKVCQTESQLKKAFYNEYGYDTDSNRLHDTIKELYDKCLDEIKRDKAVVIGSLEYGLDAILDHLGGDCEILDRDG